MGRTIVREPAAFLFDEPLSNLDAKLRVQMRMEIMALQRELGVTSLYVTHDQVEAMTMADRVVVMNAGIAEQIGPPLEVYRNPASLFVAGFIGSPPMSFIDPALLSDIAPAEAETLGIRPEHCALTRPEAGRLSGTVAFCEALGADTLVHVRMAACLSCAATAIPLRRAKRSASRSKRQKFWALAATAERYGHKKKAPRWDALRNQISENLTGSFPGL